MIIKSPIMLVHVHIQHPATTASLGGYFGALKFRLLPASTYIQVRTSQVVVMLLGYLLLPSVTTCILTPCPAYQAPPRWPTLGVILAISLQV